jgi:hypothetical protein
MYTAIGSGAPGPPAFEKCVLADVTAGLVSYVIQSKDFSLDASTCQDYGLAIELAEVILFIIFKVYAHAHALWLAQLPFKACWYRLNLLE